MFVAILGPPVSAMTRIVGVACELLAGPNTQTALVTAGSVAPFVEMVTALKGRPAVYFNEAPDSALVELIARSGARMIVILEDPVTTAAELRVKRQLPNTLAVRTVSLRQAVLERALAAPSVAVLSLNDLRDRPVGQAVGIIAAAMAVPANAGQIDLASAKLAANWPLPQPEAWPSDTPAEADSAFRKTLTGYGLSDTHRHLDRLDWDPELLQLFGKNRSGAKFDLAGPPRLISHGPNFGVPVGKWTVEIDFTTFDCFSASLVVRVVSKALLAEGGFALPVRGSHRLQIAFTVEDAQFPIELHFLSNESCIEGCVQIDRLHLARTFRA